jgi:hypothetical protein
MTGSSEKNIVNIASVKTKNNIELQNTTGYFVLPFRTEKIIDSKEFITMIKNIESQIRQSKEYTRYIGFLKQSVGLRNCAFLGNIDDDAADIEFHHYPLTLFDVVSIVTEHNLSSRKSITTFSIADEVLRCHYDNIIGMIPLCETVHELFHSGNIFINLKQVFGDFHEFIKRYGLGVNTDIIEKINRLAELSENNISFNDSGILENDKLSWNIQKNKPLSYDDF